MDTTRFDGDLNAADGLTLIRMSDHDRALARKYMEEGALVADVMLRLVCGIRTVIGNTSKLLWRHKLHPRA